MHAGSLRNQKILPISRWIPGSSAIESFTVATWAQKTQAQRQGNVLRIWLRPLEGIALLGILYLTIMNPHIITKLSHRSEHGQPCNRRKEFVRLSYRLQAAIQSAWWLECGESSSSEHSG
jgi:hypothetical protein